MQHGDPLPAAENEVDQLVAAVQKMDLKYVVMTSVTRDDLPDGGAGIFADCINKLRRAQPDCKIEVLIPDFQGNSLRWKKLLKLIPMSSITIWKL